MVAFENEIPFVHRMKASFLSSLCSVDNTNSLIDFLI